MCCMWLVCLLAELNMSKNKYDCKHKFSVTEMLFQTFSYLMFTAASADVQWTSFTIFLLQSYNTWMTFCISEWLKFNLRWICVTYFCIFVQTFTTEMIHALKSRWTFIPAISFMFWSFFNSTDHELNPVFASVSVFHCIFPFLFISYIFQYLFSLFKEVYFNIFFSLPCHKPCQNLNPPSHPPASITFLKKSWQNNCHGW